MLEKIREQLMEWFDTRRKIDINVNGLLIEKAARIIQKLINTRAHKYWYIASMETSYDIKSKETLMEYFVNFELHIYSCKFWQLNEYSCGYALTIIISHREDLQLYVKQFYTLEAYRGTYSAPIFHPMQSQNDFTNLPEVAAATLQDLGVLNSSSDDNISNNEVSNNALLPPDFCHQPGRPKKCRIQSQNDVELKHIQKCTLCHKVGYLNW